MTHKVEVFADVMKERWSEITLEDGSVLRAKPIVVRIFRTDQFDNEGNPMYEAVLGAHWVLVSASEDLKARKQ